MIKAHIKIWDDSRSKTNVIFEVKDKPLFEALNSLHEFVRKII